MAARRTWPARRGPDHRALKTPDPAAFLKSILCTRIVVTCFLGCESQRVAAQVAAAEAMTGRLLAQLDTGSQPQRAVPRCACRRSMHVTCC